MIMRIYNFFHCGHVHVVIIRFPVLFCFFCLILQTNKECQLFKNYFKVFFLRALPCDNALGQYRGIAWFTFYRKLMNDTWKRFIQWKIIISYWYEIKGHILHFAFREFLIWTVVDLQERSGGVIEPIAW